MPTFREALRFWLKLGCISFGGPAAHIAILHTELVERKKWIDEPRFLRALNFCLLLPGPEATQLATYCGWLLHGVRGGLAAGVLFVLPAAVLLWGLSWVYAAHGAVWWVHGLFQGLKPAVVAIVALAAWRIGQRALTVRLNWVLAAAAFLAMASLRVPFPWVVMGAALIGWMAGARGPGLPRETVVPAVGPAAAKKRASSLRAAAILVVGWWLPVLAAAGWQGGEGVLTRLGLFFSQAALVTFGGAYAVLPYVARHAVEVQGWLAPEQMVAGLGLAEATPGPLIIVTQFVGFLAGWSQPGTLGPLAMATLGAAMATWTTFVPSLVMIFLGAPLMERLGLHPRVNAALAAVSAAVVGVVLHLAFWFGAQVFFPGGLSWGNLDGFAVGVSLLALVALQRFRWSVVAVVGASGAIGMAWAVGGRVVWG